MSIEQQLERIAVATEKCAAMLTQIAGNPVPAPQPKPTETAAPAAGGKKKSGMEAPKAAPVVAPAPEDDPFAQPAEEAAPAVTIQQLEEKLRLHAKAFGTPTTLALMAKHGADKNKTTIKSIPTTSYAALVQEIDADLKKSK